MRKGDIKNILILIEFSLCIVKIKSCLSHVFIILSKFQNSLPSPTRRRSIASMPINVVNIKIVLNAIA